MVGFAMIYGLLALGLATAIRLAYQVATTHERFAIQTIIIEGASAKTETDLRHQLAPYKTKNIFALDLAAIRHRVEEHAWVAEASVQSQLPRILKVRLIEYEPCGLVRLDQGIFVVNRLGALICPFQDYHQILDLPVMIGVAQDENRDASIKHGLDVLHAIRETSLLFWDNIETLDLSNPENMVVRLRNEPAPLYLGKKVILQNLKNYLSIAERIQNEYPSLSYIELGFSNQVAIKPQESVH